MRLKSPEELERRLGDGLDAVYLVTGDEPLLLQEAADAVRAAARDAGVVERRRFDVDTGFDWRELTEAAGSLSLFAERRLLEVRMASPRPGDAGARALKAYAAAPPADDILLVLAPRLDANAEKSQWVKALAGAGVHLPVWPVGVEQLADWLGRRLQKAGVRMDDEAFEMLCERVEGNLLAGVQAIERLKLADPERTWDAEALTEALEDDARYTPFELIDRALAGDRRRTEHVLRTLRDEGVEPLAVAGAMARELRTLAAARRAQDAGESPDAALGRMRVFRRRQSLMRRAMGRLKAAEIEGLLRDLALVDHAVKGLAQLDPWDELSRIALRLAGAPTTPLGLRLRPWLVSR